MITPFAPHPHSRRSPAPLGIWLLAGSACLLVMTGCVPRAENEVVLYSAADREYAQPILAAFQRRHPETKVASQFDLEATKTVGLATRIENEQAQPRCDLFWNNEILHTIRLEQAGLLAPTAWDVPADWPRHLRSSQGTWIAFAARARVLIVNTQLLPDRSTWPTSVLELSGAQWKGRAGVALPLFGTTATHFTVLRGKLGPERAQEWFQSVRDNAVVLSGNKQVAQAVASGQLAFGLTDTDDVLVELDNGLPVEMVFPDQQPGELGTLMIPNTLSVMRGAPHPVAAKMLGDFLLSEDIEGRLAMGPSGQFPIRPGHPERSRAAPATPVRFMDVDFRTAADDWPAAGEQLRAIYHGSR
jgi:iron(III) transport system substrate-binding protein